MNEIPNVANLIKSTFGGAKEPSAPIIPPAPQPLPPPPKIPRKPKHSQRTVNNNFVAAEAQRIYKPGSPEVTGPPVAKPMAKMVEQGTSEKLGMSGSWGTPK